MYNPVATYRVQLHEKFTFADLTRQLDYLQQLGVTTLYASPVLAATPGSTHGYDGIDPRQINPELGTLDDLRRLSQDLRRRGMGWLQDIVPNHLAYHPANPWLMDVLEKGQQSGYAGYFDIPGTNELFEGTLMAPLLGQGLAETIARHELRVVWQNQRLMLAYYDNLFPVAPHTYAQVLLFKNEKADNEPVNNVPEPLMAWLSRANALYGPEVAPTAERDTQWEAARLELDTLLTAQPALDEFVARRLAEVNQSEKAILALCEAQHYRLCAGTETRRQINYRRFFTVNGLICLAVEQPHVFDDVHSLVRELVAEGTFQGLRVDHVDGLFDPPTYLQQLRQTVGEETYLVVEKILESGVDTLGEALPATWPIQGSTGYEYLALVNNLLTDAAAEDTFTAFYAGLVGNDTPLHEQILSRKAYILYHDMGGELANLHRFFEQQNLVSEEELSAVNPAMLRLALAELLVQCPVYRYYGNQFPLAQPEAEALRQMLNQVRNRALELGAAADLLETVWLEKPRLANADYNARALRTYQRCMQFTGPLMAKGVEDTLFYTYFRFIGHNEVGDAPGTFGLGAGTFHGAMQARQAQWPLAMSTTATHDTKRGEDTRARLNVLTDLGHEWTQTAQRWLTQTDAWRTNDMPDRNDAYFVLQTLVGAWPLPGQPHDDLPNRLAHYLTKALQEAKRHTNWTAPNQPYMAATHAYLTRLLNPAGTFWPDFEVFMARIADFSVINSLVQVLLKFTTPGVPDVYQGCELFDFSLVDPDNRRPVNYAHRASLLADSGQKKPDFTKLWADRYSGQIKLWLTQTLLHERRQNPDFWATAAYHPLTVTGTFREHVLAFARTTPTRSCVVVVPLHLARLCRETNQTDLLRLDWQDTAVSLPAWGHWHDVWQNRPAGTSLTTILGQNIPVGLLMQGE